MRKLCVSMIVITLLLLVVDFLAEFYAVDVCLDAGRVYDYVTSTCREDVEHFPYIAYLERKSGVVLTVLSLLAGGIATFVKAGRKNP